MVVITPFFRSPFTDLTGCLVNHQMYDKCGEYEMNMMDCLEAYGVERGKVMCKELIDDFNECFALTKQIARFEAMRMERMRQHRNGERSKENLFPEGPATHAY